MKKRVLSILLCVCMVLSMLPVPAWAVEPTKTIPSYAFSSGQDGSYETPYEITTTAQFAYLDSAYGTHYFILKSNLNFGGNTTGISELTSYLEGQGHTISNYAGTLVGNNMGGTLTNLIIDSPVKYVPTTNGKAKVNYFGDANQPTYQQEFGFICAKNQGLISSVQIKNATIQLYNEVGGGSWGLDWYDSTIYNRMSFITAVNATRGFIRNCSVVDCTVEVSTTMVQFGALASIVETGLITGCSVIGLKFKETGNVSQFSNYTVNNVTKGVDSYEAGIMIGYMRYGTMKNIIVGDISCLKKDGSNDSVDENLQLIGATADEGDYEATVDTVQYIAGKTSGMDNLQSYIKNINKVSSLDISAFNTYKDIVSSNNGSYHDRNLERSTTRPYLPIGYEAYLGQGKTQVVYWNHTELVSAGEEITLPLYTENTQDHSASYNDTYYDTFVDTYKVKYTKDGTDYGANPKKAGTKITVPSKGITINFDGDKIPYIVVDTSSQMGNTFVPKFNLTTDLVKWYDSYETADIDRVYPNLQSEIQQKVSLIYTNANGDIVTDVSKEPYGVYWVSFDSSNIYPGQLKNSTAKAQLWHTGPLTPEQAIIRNTSNSYTGNIVSAKIPVLEEAKASKPELSYEIWYEGTGTTTYELTQTAPKEVGTYNVYVKNLTAYQGKSYETSWAATDSVLLDTMSIADVGIIVSIDNVLQTNDFSIRYIKDGLEQTVNMSDGSINVDHVPNGSTVDLYYKTAKIFSEENFDISKLYNYDLISLNVYSALDSGLAFGEKSSVSELNNVSENDMVLRYFVKRGTKLSEVLTGQPSVYTYSLDTNGSKSVAMTFEAWKDATDLSKTLDLDSIIDIDLSAIVASYSNERWSNLTVGETYYIYTGNVGTNLGANHNFTQFIYGGTINSRHDRWSDGYLNKVTLRDTITREMFISKEAYPYTWLNYVGTTNGYKLMGSNDGVSLDSNMSYAQSLRIPTAGSYALYNGSNSAVISPKMSGNGFYQTNQPWNDRTQLYTKLGLAAAVINENGEYCWDKNYVDLRSAEAVDSYYTDASGAVTKGMSFSTQYGARLVIELLNEHKVNTNARITNQNQIHVVTLNFGKYAVDPEVSSIKCVFTTSSTDNYTISARPSQAKESMIGFNTTQDGSGTTYILGDLIPSSVTTLYAFGWQSLTEEECLDMGLDSKYIGYYPLYSPADFQRASTLVQTSNPGANFLVMNDIDFENIISTPIGYEVPYTGTLDGNFHVLRNINISSYMYSGLIGRAGNNATVKCLGIESGYFTVTGSTYVYRYLGAIIGYTEKISGLRAYIDRCWVGKDVLMDRNGLCGGLCGSGGHYNTSSSSTCHITDSYFLGSFNVVKDFDGTYLFLYPGNTGSTVNNSFGVGKENIKGPGGILNNTYYNIVKNYLNNPINTTDEQFSSGEIAWKLNFDGGDVTTTHRGIWTQDADYPMLVRGSLKPTYRVTFSGDGVDTVYAYSNANGNVAIPASVADRELTYNSENFTANTVVNSDINVTVGANATQTEAPVFAADGSTSIIQGSAPKNAVFTLENEPVTTIKYVIYSAEIGGTLRGTVSQSGKILNVTLFSAPTAESTDYYIAAQEENKAESPHTKVTCTLKPEPVFNSDISNVTAIYGDGELTWNNSLKTGDGVVSFQSSNNDVVEVSSNGTLTIKDVGSSTITVSVAEGTNNRAKTFAYTVSVNPKDVTETIAGSSQNIIENVGSFTEPTFNSVTGTLKYSWNSETNKTYAEAVNYLKTLNKDDTVILNYSYAANGNYTGTISGTINLTVIGFNFTGDGLTIEEMPIYGVKWNDIIQLDSSKYSAKLNNETILGSYRIQLKTGTEDYTDMVGTIIPTAGDYSYQVLFDSNDNEFTNTVVELGTFTVEQRIVELIWSNTSLSYNGNLQAPTATISNIVGEDVVTVTITGGQTNVGNEYIATADVLEGADKNNYKLPDVKPTQSFSIAHAATNLLWGNVTQSVVYTGNEAVIVAPTVTQINNEPYDGTITYFYKAKGTSDDYTAGLPVDAGTWVIKAHMTASGNYAAADSADIVLTIAPATLTINSVTVEDRVYIKNDTSVTVSEVIFDGGSVTDGIDYTVAGSMTNANAGDNKEVTVTVTMTNINYDLSSSTAVTTVKISKAEAVTLTDKSASHRYNLIGEQSIIVDGMMPEDAGTLTYSKGAEGGTTTIVTAWSVETDGTVKYTLAGGSIGSSITLPVKINSDNYGESTVNVVITLSDKDSQPAPADFNLEFTLNDDGITYTVTIPLVDGAEYSFDGIKWSADNTKTNITPSDSITGYIRMKATEEKNISAPTSDTKMAPSMVETPFAIPNGGMFSGTQTVTLDCLTDGASIYYNTNGLKPTTDSTLYEYPFTIADTTTVTAIAVKAGMHKSEVLTVAFTKYIGGNMEVSQSGWTYGETPSEPIYIVPDGVGAISTTYSGITASGVKYSSNTTKPTHAGEYTFTVHCKSKTVAYNGIANFTISPKTLTVTGLEAISRTYDGTNYVVLNGGTLNGVIGNDDVHCIFTEGTMENADIGNNKSVKVTIPILTGADAFNYKLGKLQDITVNISPRPSSGGGNTTSAGGNTITKITVPVSTDEGKVQVEVSVKDGVATISMTDKQLQEITSNSGTIGNMIADLSLLDVKASAISSQVISALNNSSGSVSLSVAFSTGTITLDSDALDYIANKGDMKVSVENVDNEKLTVSQREMLGAQANSAFVVDINVSLNGNNTKTFGNGKIQVSVPYTLKSGESTDNITVWFINNDGTIEAKNGSYRDGKVEFTTEHLSQYLIVNFPFRDVAENSWYYNSVAYAYNNGLFAGTSYATFSPDTAMTRQMIWMVLARMDGKLPANIDEARNWAMENNISDGTKPTDTITREQMAAILYRYAQYKGYDTTIGGMAIREFEDYENTSEYALTALGWMVNAGLMQGTDKNLMPYGSATRAQVAAILQRFYQSIEN